MTAYVLSPRAKRDVDDIRDYTLQRWGLDQAETYLTTLRNAFIAIARDPEIGRAVDHIRPGYRKYPAGSHIVFYRLRGDRVDIVRVLHRRMDFARHL